MPLPAPSISHQPPPAPRVEKKPESKNVDDILKPPGRESRPERVSPVWLTSFIANQKLIRDLFSILNRISVLFHDMVVFVFFFFNLFYWSIVDMQGCVNFFCIAK